MFVNMQRNRNSWGPTSIPSPIHRMAPDSELEEECSERMMSAQMRQLDPLKEDLADWLNKTLAIDYVTRDNFLSELDNGVVLCHLAQVIQDRARTAIETGRSKGPPPTIRGKCFEKAMRRSFFSRDNMENFIKFCRALGVHENLLFESDDLVLHNQPRNVILCLLEVARIATRYDVEPPGLVQLEKEIAEEERNQSADSGLGSILSWQFQASPNKHEQENNKMRTSFSASAISSYARWNTGPQMVLIPDSGAAGDHKHISVPPSGASDGVPSDNTEDEWSRGSGEDPDLEIQPEMRRGPTGDALTELDRKVQHATRLMQKNCNCSNGKCSKLSVKKVGEGRYNIAGKNVFIRLLKGRHMMVRVGGGWDTLDHFLLRHDPCQVKVVSREKIAKDLPVTPTSGPKFLHIRAKYRS